MKIYDLYQELFDRYGNPEKFWPQWCTNQKSEREREIIALGAILTQRTSWRNADVALLNLKKNNLISLKTISQLKNLDNLSELIKPAGFYQTKPRRVFELACFVEKQYKGIEKLKKENPETIRQKLLSLYGIGPETADVILLYALDKPSFVIDEYTKRFSKENKLSKNFDYDYLKKFFEKSLPKDTKIYQNFHALIIADQRKVKGMTMKKI